MNIVKQRQPGQAELLPERRNLVPALAVLGQGYHRKVLARQFRVKPFQGRHFANAGSAPGRPKIDQNDLAPKILKRPFAAFAVGKNGVRRGDRSAGRLEFFHPSCSRRPGIGVCA